MLVCVVVDVRERASDCGDDVPPHPGQGGSVGGKGRRLGNVCADQGKDRPVARRYGEYARCKVRRPVSFNVLN
jgi:hypothetical protein